MTEEKTIQRSIEVRLGVQKVLLGRISERIRAIYCGWGDTTVDIYIIFHGPIQEQDHEDIRLINSHLATLFPENSIDIQALRVDYPQERPIFENAYLVYLRKENKVE